MVPNIAPDSGSPPFQAAFLSYCRGYPLGEIALFYGIPLVDLEKRALDEHWAQLAGEIKVPAAKGTRAGDMAVINERLEQNRTTNYRMFCKLRDVLVQKIGELQEGTLKVERLFHDKKSGAVVSGWAEPGPSDLVSLATAAKTVAEGTYRALGDMVAAEDKSQRSLAPAVGITVLIPGIVATKGSSPPADPVESAKPAQAEIVDLR